MATEIERKYLVKGDFRKEISETRIIRQGYICTAPERTVRIRIEDSKAYITIKGEQVGISRYEWEKEIEPGEAEELMKLCQGRLVEKRRHFVNYMGWLFEVDEFTGENEGLVVAEIELDSEDNKPELPDWIGKEVSDDHRYHNSNLSRNPWTGW